MTKHVLVIQPLHPDALSALEAREDITYSILTDFSEENLLRHAPEADVITIRDAKLPVSVIDSASRLKAISRHGVGYDNIPIEYCTSKGIPVTVVGAVTADAVAEHAIFLMFASARCVISLDTAVRQGDFAIRGRITGQGLTGRTLLLIGFGRIGRRVGLLARAMGMRVIVYDPYLTASLDDWAVRVELLTDGLAQADVLSLHLPLTPETHHMIGPRELSALRKGAIVVNVSRGGLIDEGALLRAVQSGHLHGAGLDVFETEPVPADSSILEELRIVVSPHFAALTDQALLAMSTMTVKNALDALDGCLNADLVINREVLENLTALQSNVTAGA